MQLFNTLTGHKERFVPLESNHIRMYVCGVTVYDDCHLGHARSAIVFDVLRRYWQFRGYQVTYVKNFTDIDDKIVNRSLAEHTSWNQIAEYYISSYETDMKRLGVLPPDKEPKATEHMADIINLIQGLIQKGHAYRLNGDVYYSVSSYPEYGRLSKRSLENMLAGARVEVDERKRDPMDFALWKAAKPGEPAWESPWGNGRPGWHIECSAMALDHLGETFDVHGGGKDLIFPHHENEIAQSCAWTGKEFARFWVHHGFVTIDEEKMSKSLGNFFTIKDIFAKSQWPESVTAEALRYFLLATHYRSDVNFSDQALSDAKSALDNLYDLFQRLEEEIPADRQMENSSMLESRLAEFEQKFEHAMDDDLNTPKALAEFQRLRGDVNKLVKMGFTEKAKTMVLESFRKCGKPLGLFQLSSKDWVFSSKILEGSATLSVGTSADRWTGKDDEQINQQIKNRQKAREAKDFATADKIRKELAEQGIILEDRPDGTTRWKR